MKVTLAVVLVLAACDPQVDGNYAGDPIVRVRGLMSGFSPDDVIDGGELRWNTQVGADLRTGPATPEPVITLTGGVELDVLDEPDGEAGFDFGDGVTIDEGHMLLTNGGTLMGDAINYALVYVDADVADGSLAASYLGGPVTRGYHLCSVRPTVNMPPAQAVLADRCGGTPECASQRRYQLDPADGDLGAEVQFYRSGP